MLINPKHTLLKPAGWVHKFGGDGRDIEQDTYQCCHCGQHVPVEAAPGEQRGFCPKCNGVTCGNAQCHKHYPFEQKLTDYEKGILGELA